MRVDRALDLVRIAAETIESVDAAVPGAEFVAGLARLEGDLLLIYDLGRFLSLDEAAETGQALSMASRR